MKSLFLLLPFFAFSLTILPAQPGQNQYSKASDSDPQAKAILEKLKTKYEGYNSVEALFTLSIEFPDLPVEEQEGKLIQQGDKYRLDLASQAVICDGNTLWLYLKNNQEVQINDFEEGEEDTFLSPKDLLKVYEREDFVYILANEYAEGNGITQDIEFKPLDANSEYSKMRLSVDKKTSQIKRIKAFAKDGSRYTLSLQSFNSNRSYPASTFIWDSSECPDCYVEDLRID